MGLRSIGTAVTAALLGGLLSCGSAATKVEVKATEIVETKDENMAQSEEKKPTLAQADITAAINELVALHGDSHLARIETGVRQVAAKWQEDDGTAEAFRTFCKSSFIADEAKLDTLFRRFQNNIEQIRGHLDEIKLLLKKPTDLDTGPVEPIDYLFAKYDLTSHVAEDLFKTKIAFSMLLNFQAYTLEEKLAARDAWTRDQWARARAVDMFSSRVPPEISQNITFNLVSASEYIAQYNIHMHHLLTPDGKRLFPKNLSLISHWGLRDELKSHYSSPDGLAKQKMIHAVMKRIITQEIPASVIDNPHVDWVVETNQVTPSTIEDFDTAVYASKKDVPISTAPETDARYRYIINTFNALRQADPYYPALPTYIDRKFKRHREIPEEDVETLFKAILSSPVIKDVGAFISKRLGRRLEPFDIWYDGFTSRGSYTQEKLDAIVGKKYPTVAAFQKDLVKILKKLGFDPETAAFLSTKVVVEASRGAGHAWGAKRREANAHLRTRIPKTGMRYKGYNIAIHELGHNVEQVLSLNKMDHYLLAGVPNTAFTEGFAFSFQAKDLDLLGLKDKDPQKKYLKTLSTIWSTFEMCGVGLIDMEIWRWLYDHPDADPEALKQAVIAIANDVWNAYFAPVFGVRDQSLLTIYSHIVGYGMYTPDYALGYLIQFQMQDYFDKNGLAKEMERMCRLGNLTPDAWMHAAVGGGISAAPMISATEKALKALAN
ncbi:MAG: hypothetical protein QNJ97_10960 [Myxococcota bacterium]|nr:hypothetical protein [Myxococcota bacterium]